MDYTIILRDNIKLNDLQMSVTLQEDIDSIAYTANIQMVVSDEMSSKLLLMEGDAIEIIENTSKESIFKGVIWNKGTTDLYTKTADLLCKERTAYIEESEEEYLFKKGTTATQRSRQMCNEWKIPIGTLADTKIPLSKSPPKINSIYGLMLDDLKETAQKGGDLYRYRMKNKLDLIKIGSNKTVHDLTEIKTGVNQSGSIQGAVTKVKVLGKQEDEKLSTVTGVYEKNTKEIGTIQKVLQDEKITNAAQAKAAAENMFSTGQRSITVSAIDITEIRAGDKVKLNGFYTYVTSITHNLGNPGTMQVVTESLEQIRGRYYGA